MRKNERACDEAEFFKEVFSKAQELFLAFHAGDFPYIVPLNFVYQEPAIYLHCATEGHKLDLLAADDRVGFSAAAEVAVDREKSTTYYKSVCGTGHARLVTDPAEKQQALAAIAGRYQSGCRLPAPEGLLARVVIVRIDIASLSGKRNLPK